MSRSNVIDDILMFTLMCLVIFTYYVKSVHKIIVSSIIMYLSLGSAYIMQDSQDCHKIVIRLSEEVKIVRKSGRGD